MGADHEGFADFDAGASADGEEGFGVGGIHAEGLFAENVLAGFGGFCGPGDVKIVGKWIVDGVDFGIGEEFFVGAVGLGNVVRRGGFLGFLEAARGDGVDGAEFALLHSGNDFAQTDGCGAEYAPAKLLRHEGMIIGGAERDGVNGRVGRAALPGGFASKMVRMTPPMSSRRRSKTPPPGETGQEALYLRSLSERQVTVSIKLRDGETVRGWIEYFDEGMLRLTREGKPNLFIYKQQIRSITEVGRNQRRTPRPDAVRSDGAERPAPR
jgi:host factor-I protein